MDIEGIFRSPKANSTTYTGIRSGQSVLEKRVDRPIGHLPSKIESIIGKLQPLLSFPRVDLCFLESKSYSNGYSF